MKILMINKFLYPNGGSETYIFKLGEYLEKQGHKVEFFGMEHEGRCVGNSVGHVAPMRLHRRLHPFGLHQLAEVQRACEIVAAQV